VLPADAGIEVGGEPTTAADAAAAAGVEVDRWGHGGTPSGTLDEHYWMERPLLRDHNIADELWKYPSSVECHALL
jgi:hypothetical protein